MARAAPVTHPRRVGLRPLRPAHSPRARESSCATVRIASTFSNSALARCGTLDVVGSAALRGRAGGRLGVSFRRQVPLAGRFIADLYASEVQLVVEVNGGYQAGRAEPDAPRDRALVRIGGQVLRLEAELVMSDLPAAVERVRVEIERLRGGVSASGAGDPRAAHSAP